MSHQYGVVVGVVTDVDDPDRQGRIRVEYPWMEGQSESFWATPATLMGGADRGSWFAPETGDEVLVAFDRGDVNHPYVLGYLWNGVDQPPNADIDHNVRRLRTVSGHQIDFDDRTGQRRIELRSASGHVVSMDDDGGAGSIRLETPTGVRIEIDAAAKITLVAPSTVEVRAAKTRFSGIVEAPLVRAKLVQSESVVSKAYAPGAGNAH